MYHLFETHLIHKVSVSQKSLLMMFWRKSTKLGNRKTIQSTDIRVKILKQNADIFGGYIWRFFNVCVKVRFHLYWNMLILHLSLKKVLRFQRKLPTGETAMPMITHFMAPVILLRRSNYKVHPNNFFNVYRIIRWRVTLKSVILYRVQTNLLIFNLVTYL